MFLAPWFLAGLLAVGVPLWLHRIARSERVKVPFASLMLLEASEVRDTSRRSLRYWLLLAVRIALLVALVLAFAQPLLKASSDTFGTGPSRLQAIVLDTSLSMQYGDRWQRALDQASVLMNEVKGNDRAMLVAASGRKIEVLAGPVLAEDIGALRGALTAIKPTMDRLDYGMLMSSSATWLSAAGLSAEIHLITDMQQSASPLRFADLAPPANTKIVLHDVGETEPTQNLAIANVATQGAEDRVFTVTVRGTQDEKSARELSMSIDDHTYPSKRIILDKSNTAQVTFPAVKLRAGTHRVKFELQPKDKLPQDDSFYAVIEHTEPSVLLVTRDPASDEAAYLASAIESQTAAHLTVERATPLSLTKILADHPLRDYSAVFVADSGLLTESMAQQLMRYVDAGGSVFATLGPKASQLAKEPISGLAIGKTNDIEQRVAVVDESHPVLRDSSGWSAVRFMKRTELRLTDNSPQKDRVLIALADQSPLLVERIGSAGRLLILTAPLDRTWNDLAIHPLFVRFIADAAGYLTARDVTAMSYVVGSRIATGVNAGTGGQIFDPNAARVLALDDASEASHLTPTQTGFYEVRSGKQKHWLAVNVDTRESDLAPLSADAVGRWRELSASATEKMASTIQKGAPDDPSAATARESEQRSLGWHFLIAALVLLLLELLLANYRLTIRRDGTRVAAA